jgi:hypothetical protein
VLLVDEKKTTVAKHKAKGKLQYEGKAKDKMKSSLLDSNMPCNIN